LLDGFPLEVPLAYCFARLEKGQNMALYCGAVKIFRTHTSVTQNAMNGHHMTRKEFARLYEEIFDCRLPEDASTALRAAEKIRDAALHGKKTTPDQIRNAIANVIDFSVAINAQLRNKWKLQPFDDLQGFAGASRKKDERISRLILKGMGLSVA
jgi:hypothetical protein